MELLEEDFAAHQTNSMEDSFKKLAELDRMYKDRTFGEDWKGRLTTSGTLRYFTPREVANLLGFPASFDFPPNIRTKKAYGMMGNSLHVGVAAKVIEFALR